MKRSFGVDGLAVDAGSVLTVGTFDGVHLGHQAIIRYLVERARIQGGRSVVVSFDPHPREVVHGEAVPLLTTLEERAAELEALGLDGFVVLPFTPAFARLSPSAFIEEVLVRHIGLQEIVIGYDHGFGRGRSGGREDLERLGRKHGFSVDVIPGQVVAEHVVSSTQVRRQLLDGGAVKDAARLLGRYYSLAGTVVLGSQRGRTLGYPTANLSVNHPRKVVPAEGVYAVNARVSGEASRMGGMMNIGTRPTFDGEDTRLEVHLFDVSRDLYGQELRVEFVERIRPEVRFDSVEALKKQLSKDRARCMAALKVLT